MWDWGKPLHRLKKVTGKIKCMIKEKKIGSLGEQCLMEARVQQILNERKSNENLIFIKRKKIPQGKYLAVVFQPNCHMLVYLHQKVQSDDYTLRSLSTQLGNAFCKLLLVSPCVCVSCKDCIFINLPSLSMWRLNSLPNWGQSSSAS